MREWRPIFFDLTQIDMPVGAVTSITHRVTGILLALGVPFAIHLLELSLRSPRSYAHVVGILSEPMSKVFLLLFVWALTHHLLAGLRHLLSDIDMGSHLRAARSSAWIVNCSAVVVALLSAGALF